MTGNDYNFNHNLANQYPIVIVADGGNRKLKETEIDVYYTNSNTTRINFLQAATAGQTYKITAIG